MKIKLNQEIQNEFGKPLKRGNFPPVTLKDIIVASILQPVRDEEEHKKLEKYDIFKKIRSKKEEVELKAEEITTIKKMISKFQPQLIVGQCHEMIEGKYERMEPIETPEEEIQDEQEVDPK